jgi:transposase-like protein
MSEAANGKSKSRRHFGDEQKAAIVRRHLADKAPVSDLADEYHIQPSLIYLWVKQVLDQAERAFRQASGGKRRRAAEDSKDRKIAQLETQLAQRDAKLAQKNEVIAELMEDNVRSKKATGEL